MSADKLRQLPAALEPKQDYMRSKSFAAFAREDLYAYAFATDC